ncbi:FadR/GntR family transcriptional regulator [Marispirochaeta aestuarii]|uniref:FadR/GntR family transcriptional regulator n=1 Tax=Marispirochaeta aestuarii TaxID=1963862 RepID=UPI0029C96BF5|nr:FadR/GntR family transcriptional regulator [Marispirochaeta aestuarii]
MYKKLGSSGHRLSDEVTEHIKMLIRNEHLKPGDKIPNEIELGRLFGVSRPTIRQAVNSLVSQNIVEIVRGRGTFVSRAPGLSRDPLGLEFILAPDLQISLAEARLAIEPGVARLAAENATEKGLNKIGECIEKMREVVHEHRIGMAIELDFHRSIAEASCNQIIMRVVPIILDSILNTYADSNPTIRDHGVALEEHTAVYKAIAGHDADKAFSLMQTHLKNSHERLVRRKSDKAS